MQIKRSISVILTAVLLCMAILMTSCDALSVKKVEEDPTEQLMSSTSSTATNVVNSISPLDPVKAALKKGLFEISYSNDEIGNISNRFYIDAEAKKAADIASVELMGEKIDLGIYGADSKLAVSSSLLGDSAYGFDFTTLAEDAKNSEFWALVGTTYSEAEAQIGDLLDSLSGFSEKEDEIKKSLEDLKKEVKKVLNKTDVSVSKDKVSVGGEDIKAILINYEFGKDTVNEIAGLVIDWYADFMKAYTEMLPAGSSDIDLDPAEMKSSLADILDEVDNLKFKLSFALNVKSADIMLFEGEMTGESDEGKAKAEVTVDFGKNPAESDSFDAKMKLTDVDGQEISAKATVKRTNDKDSFERKISLNAESDGESHSLEIGFKHDKESKNFSFCYTMDDEKAEVNGTLEYSDNDLSLVVEKIIINGEETVLESSCREGRRGSSRNARFQEPCNHEQGRLHRARRERSAKRSPDPQCVRHSRSRLIRRASHNKSRLRLRRRRPL
ncbi:MAG: hypothetical protein ACLUFM_00195 [Lachnospiraceae bacterium]